MSKIARDPGRVVHRTVWQRRVKNNNNESTGIEVRAEIKKLKEGDKRDVWVSQSCLLIALLVGPPLAGSNRSDCEVSAWHWHRVYQGKIRKGRLLEGAGS